MKIIMDIPIYYAPPGSRGHLHSTVRKQLDSDLIPFPGISFEDGAWKEPHEPVRIVCSFVDQCYYLPFPSLEFTSEKEYEREIEMYEKHGWNRLVRS